METIFQRALLALAFLCGAVAIWNGDLPAAVVASGIAIAWAIYSAAWLMTRSERR